MLKYYQTIIGALLTDIGEYTDISSWAYLHFICLSDQEMNVTHVWKVLAFKAV